MANSVSTVASVQQAAQVSAAQQQAQAPKPAAKQVANPQDTVAISPAGKAASQAQAVQQSAKPSGDVDHDGDNK
jgi:hypothetical protein